MNWQIAVLGGDGVGPEVTDAALHVLRATAARFGHEFTLDAHDVGFAAYERSGHPLPPETLAACRAADAVLLGAVGDPRSDGVDVELRPEAALLTLRKEMGCYANLRPVRLLPALASASPLRRSCWPGVFGACRGRDAEPPKPRDRFRRLATVGRQPNPNVSKPGSALGRGIVSARLFV